MKTFYYPERLWNIAISHAKGWGRSFENRTIRTENGDSPCLDVKDYNGETIYHLIIDDDLYIHADLSERMTFEYRFLLLHDAGERIIMASDRKDATKQAKQYCKENGRQYKELRYMS